MLRIGVLTPLRLLILWLVKPMKPAFKQPSLL
ncbi:hypothetical protein L915_00472 [Phytophthora nicotianae]|uniref:Uncharacterized protein n=1 Tax=Phytophthora nicotianae TaxID=4792 RepID=W2JX82_PHYNI|nr:hypothetical protein L915_00472 [Phytophthora nicotianae]ETL50248.1 hypothetical protein L916_00474 [Phytophthora nicotianae]